MAQPFTPCLDCKASLRVSRAAHEYRQPSCQAMQGFQQAQASICPNHYAEAVSQLHSHHQSPGCDHLQATSAQFDAHCLPRLRAGTLITLPGYMTPVCVTPEAYNSTLCVTSELTLCALHRSMKPSDRTHLYLYSHQLPSRDHEMWALYVSEAASRTCCLCSFVSVQLLRGVAAGILVHPHLFLSGHQVMQQCCLRPHSSQQASGSDPRLLIRQQTQLLSRLKHVPSRWFSLPDPYLPRSPLAGSACCWSQRLLQHVTILYCLGELHECGGLRPFRRACLAQLQDPSVTLGHGETAAL